MKLSETQLDVLQYMHEGWPLVDLTWDEKAVLCHFKQADIMVCRPTVRALFRKGATTTLAGGAERDDCTVYKMTEEGKAALLEARPATPVQSLSGERT